jgi:transcriptional regulator with XRE-family HTH domain
MIRKRRLDLKLLQADVPRIIDCSKATVTNRERGHAAPQVGHMAAVVQFLGFNPLSTGSTTAERLVLHRKARGITQKEFARKIGVDPSTLAKWERGQRSPGGRFLGTIETILRPTASCVPTGP